MEDLISRQAAIDAIVNTATDVYSHDRIVSVLDGAAFRQNEIIDIINALPSAQPEIILCKNCRYSEYDSVFNTRYCHNKGKAEMVGDNFFCAAGRYQTNGSD